MSREIVLASNNAGKLAEFRQLFAEHAIDFIPLSQFSAESVDEVGLTFVENAILKARNACRQSGLPAIADDSGLEVYALQGAPGIYTARYGGENATQEMRHAKLLQALADTPMSERGARFRCVLVYLQHYDDPSPIICEGDWEGLIALAPAGGNGFGYDPIFYVPEKSCTSAQLPEAEKHRLSHRGKALRQLLARLTERHRKVVA